MSIYRVYQGAIGIKVFVLIYRVLLGKGGSIPRSSAPRLLQPGYFVAPRYSQEPAKLRSNSKGLSNAL